MRENDQLRNETDPAIRRQKIKTILSGFSTLNPIIKAQLSSLKKKVNEPN